MKGFVQVGVVAALFSISASAGAWNWKKLPGSACVPATLLKPVTSFTTNNQGHLSFGWTEYDGQ